MDLNFPYKTSFSCELKPLVSAEKDKYLAMASLIEVGKFIPNIDTKKNYDLLPVAFNACVVNRVNKNDDGIDTPTAIAIYKEFINKPINVEHNRQKVLGVILVAGFSEFKTDKPLTLEEVKELKGPFNIVLGGVVWRTVNSRIADLIEESNDKESDNYQAISASWELGFHDYNILILSGNDKNVESGTLVKDEAEIEKLTPFLKSLGGNGVDENNKRVCRMPCNSTDSNVVPLGIGFTENPAAEVKGIAVEAAKKDKEKKDKAKADELVNDVEACGSTHFINKCSCGETISQCRCVSTNKTSTILENGCEKCKEKAALAAKEGDKKITISENKISQKEKTHVIQERNIMKIKSLNEITDESLKQISASSIAEFVHDQLTEKAKSWEPEKASLEKKAKDAETLATEATKTLEEVKAELKKVQATVETLNNEKAEREKVEKFNTRMNEVSEAYELGEDERKLVVEEVKSLVDDASFEKWKTKAAVLLKGFAKKKDDKDKNKKKNDSTVDDSKDKGDQVANSSEVKAKLEKAYVAAASQKDKETILAEAIEKGVKLDEKIINTGGTAEPTLKEKAATAFAVSQFTVKI